MFYKASPVKYLSHKPRHRHGGKKKEEEEGKKGPNRRNDYALTIYKIADDTQYQKNLEAKTVPKKKKTLISPPSLRPRLLLAHRRR